MNKSEIYSTETYSTEIYSRFYEQMARDYSCTVNDVADYDNHIVIKDHDDCARKFKSSDYIAKIISVNGKYILSVDEKIYKEVLKLKDSLPGEWISMSQFSDAVNNITAPLGYKARDQHHFYLPTGTNGLSQDIINQMKEKYVLRWYEKDEIDSFRGDERFTSALSFVEEAPDMLALTATLNGRILGMCGVSADCQNLWQIGINVMKDARGQNLAAFLTILMKEEILRRGRIPFYGTAESHIQSQKVALKSGFLPAWYEAYWYRR